MSSVYAVPRAMVFSAMLLAGPATRSSAQCLDGTPPPCARAQTALARRPLLPLDERTWIVVPFENITRAVDLDWLRDASVNLMYLDMSKWKDIHVIDDERVRDYVRELPGARATTALSLQNGINVAKRADAGRLVMGDVIKLGNRIQLVGKIFDVKTSQCLLTVRRIGNARAVSRCVMAEIADVAG